MQKLLFATNNKHKLSEVRSILSDKYEVLSLEELEHTDELAEDGSTLEENALQKARFIYNTYKINCFSEDTGLEVDALNGEPGVNTAIYAGPQRSAFDNISLLLKNLETEANRSARFRTVVILIIDGNEFVFEGEVRGTISLEPYGTDGFGYDPVFIPNGYDKPFALIPGEVKNTISHRANAVKKLIKFINSL